MRWPASRPVPTVNASPPKMSSRTSSSPISGRTPSCPTRRTRSPGSSRTRWTNRSTPASATGPSPNCVPSSSRRKHSRRTSSGSGKASPPRPSPRSRNSCRTWTSCMRRIRSASTPPATRRWACGAPCPPGSSRTTRWTGSRASGRPCMKALPTAAATRSSA